MSNTNNIIIEDDNLDYGGSGTGNILSISEPEYTPNLVDIRDLNLLPLSSQTPEENDILIYNGSVYIPTPLVISLISDIDLTGLASNNILSYNSISGKWEPKNINSLVSDSLQFNSLITPTVNDILSYNGTKWVPVSRNSILSNFSLSNLGNVLIDSQLDGQLLSFNSTTGKWENRTLSLLDLSDLSNINPIEGDILLYNGTSGEWEPTELTIDNLSNFSTSGVSEKDLLSFNLTSGKWENKKLVDVASEVASETDLLELKDVTILNKLDKQFLVWDSALQKWINYSPSLIHLSDYNSSNDPNEGDILKWDSQSNTWITYSYTVQDLFSYDLGELSTGKTLIYNSSTLKWEPKYITLTDLFGVNFDENSLSSGSTFYWNSINNSWELLSKSFEDLLNLPGVSNNQILSYNSADSKWENKDIEDLVQLSQNLSNLNDIALLNLSNKDFLIYNSSLNIWENRPLYFSDLKNISLTSLSNRDFLRYNSITSKWERYSLKLENLVIEGIDVSTIEEDSTIHWDSSNNNWVFKKKTLEEILGFSNSTPEGSVLVWNSSTLFWETRLASTLIEFSNDLNSLLDTNFSSLENNEILVYDSATSKWINKGLDISLISDIDLTGIQNTNILVWESLSSSFKPANLSNLIDARIDLSSIEDLLDVDITLPADKELLLWDAQTSTWINNKITPGSFKNLSLLNQDTSKYLTWNSISQSWEFNEYTLENLVGIDFSTLPDKSVLLWDLGSQSWGSLQAFELNELIAPEIDLGELKDVEAPNKLNNQMLTWDSALQKWVPKTPSDLGYLMVDNLNVPGNDWVDLFNQSLNY